MRGFTYFESYKKAIRNLPDEVRLAIRDAIDDFMFDDIEPEFTNIYAASLFELMRPTLEKSKNNGKNQPNDDDENRNENSISESENRIEKTVSRSENRNSKTVSRSENRNSKTVSEFENRNSKTVSEFENRNENSISEPENRIEKMTSKDKDKEKDKDIGDKKEKEKVKKEKPINPFLQDPVLRDAFRDFSEMRQKKKKPLTDRAIGMLYTASCKITSDAREQAKLLDQSTLKGWDSVYPLQDDFVGARDYHPEEKSDVVKDEPGTESEKYVCLVDGKPTRYMDLHPSEFLSGEDYDRMMSETTGDNPVTPYNVWMDIWISKHEDDIKTGKIKLE